MHKLARRALAAYGLADARLNFLTYHGNVIYRVDERPAHCDVPERYTLRIHMLYHSTAAITSELQWLSALGRELDLPGPEPIRNRENKLVTEIDDPGVEGVRQCTLLRWVNGRFLNKKLRTVHVRAWGRLMARLHEHAAQWRRPSDFTRRHRNWEGLFGTGAGFEHPADELWAAVPKKYMDTLRIVTGRLRSVMERWGTGPEVYGLVHADLDVKTNILFKRGEARVIDFDDCCFAYWLHDVAFALGPWWGTPDWSWIRDSLWEGYTKVRPFPDDQRQHLNLFIAAYHANLLFWMLDWAKSRPELAEPQKQVNHYGDKLLLYAERL